eukprot:m.14141 g.14141  ORF g.14141 m.14141 type:complete len:217 (-) comp7697_c0_seq8:76-726(-)
MQMPQLMFSLYPLVCFHCVASCFGKPPELQVIFRRIVEGLVFLHRMDVVHRDIKPENVLLRLFDPQNGADLTPLQRAQSAVIADFGCGRFMNDEDSLTLKVGTPEYKPPEVVSLMGEYDTRWDVWGVGCTLAFCLFGHHPFPVGPSIEEKREATMRIMEINPVFEIREDAIPPNAYSFITTCMQQKDDRPFFVVKGEVPEIFSHPFIDVQTDLFLG